MSVARVMAALAIAVAMLTAVPSRADAHPLGNFSVNRYSRVEVGPDQATLRYVLDLAEIPTLQELSAAGLPADAAVDAVERAILPARVARIASSTSLAVDGHTARWDVRSSSLELPEGQAGLRTMRIALTLFAPVDARDGARIEYRDGNEPGRTGWHEVVLLGRDGVTIAESTVPARDLTDELRHYPADPTSAPLDVDRATAQVRLAPATTTADGAAAPGAVASRFGVDAISDRVTDLLRAGSAGDLLATLLALAAAAGIGAVHAMTPGHGKTVMAAYLVGTRGTPRQAFALGGVVALSHTAGVLGLAVVILGASSVVRPERFYPYLSALSALIVLGIGLGLVLGLLRRRAHEHRHGHAHDPSHGHDHGAGGRVGWRALVALGVSGGAIPSASAVLLLLAAVSLRRPELGVVLIIAFGVGMAAVLVGTGLTLVGAGRLAARHLGGSRAARRVAALVPAATAVTVLLVGAGLSVQAGQQLLAALL